MEALGPVLILLSVPFVFRWVPQNRIYGFRVPATRRNKSVWYDANALFARHAITLGAILVLLEFMVPASARVLTLRLVAFIGLVTIVIADWRTANRWERERRFRKVGAGPPEGGHHTSAVVASGFSRTTGD